MGCANSSMEVLEDLESDVYLEKRTHISADITEKIIRKNKSVEMRKPKLIPENHEEPRQDIPVPSITMSQGQDVDNIESSLASQSSMDMP